ncbi:MAG TPA: galactose-1-phosphate uridylyltransferase [Candidatus Sulfotelmatobacter sp.]|nr:galactose-1-phosphate uridylyltransferase [Candidatus Sulfotelmatobacter sp.]
MSYNELRKDFLIDRWVVIATYRAKRPTDFAKQRKEQTPPGVCPMCPGNEHMTPPAVLVYLKSDGNIVKDKDTGMLRHKNWLIRCVPNLYPAFGPPKEPIDPSNIMKSDNFGLAVGHHEVLIESPQHDCHPADAEIPQLTHVINSYIDRLRDLSSKPYVRYVSIFRNHGQEAGASLTHAHSQIIAMPFVPTIVDEEVKASMNFWNQHGKCAFCDLTERETKGSRLIQETEHFVVLAPYASVNPMETWIIPKKHNANILNLTDLEKEAFAKTLKMTLKALKDLVNDPPYNYAIHLSINKQAQDYYHWHVEVYPRLAIWAGYEKSTGVYINIITPETAAEEYRRTILTSHL